MSLLVEDFDVHLGKVHDNMSELYISMVRQPYREFLRIFNQPEYEDQKRKKHVHLDEYVVKVRVKERAINCITNMCMDELDGPTLLARFREIGFEVDAIICKPAPEGDPRVSIRTKVSFILLRRNDRNVLKEIMRIDVLDHFANESIWNAIVRVWGRYPKNYGQANDKELFMCSIYEAKRQMPAKTE